MRSTNRWARFTWPDIGEGRDHYIVHADEDGYVLACGRVRDMVPSSIGEEPGVNVCPGCAGHMTVRAESPTATPVVGIGGTAVKAAVWAMAIGFAVWAGRRFSRAG